MLKEVLVVEGKMDTVAVKRAVEADTIETGGYTLAPHTLELIAAAYRKRGIIILTDPDSPGERIRRFLTDRFPKAGQRLWPTMMWASKRLAPRPFAKPCPKFVFRKWSPERNFPLGTYFCPGFPVHRWLQ